MASYLGSEVMKATSATMQLTSSILGFDIVELWTKDGDGNLHCTYVHADESTRESYPNLIVGHFPNHKNRVHKYSPQVNPPHHFTWWSVDLFDHFSCLDFIVVWIGDRIAWKASLAGSHWHRSDYILQTRTAGATLQRLFISDPNWNGLHASTSWRSSCLYSRIFIWQDPLQAIEVEVLIGNGLCHLRCCLRSVRRFIWWWQCWR